MTANSSSSLTAATAEKPATPADTTKRTHPLVHFIAGGIGGTVGAVVTCPLEVVKTRLQSSLYRTQHAQGVFGLMRTIYRTEGIRGLWRGIGPNLVGVMPARAIYFSMYASTKHYLTHDLSINNGKESSLIHLLSAAAAGTATATTTNPIWLIKTRMQLQQGAPLAAAASNASKSASKVSGSTAERKNGSKSTFKNTSSPVSLTARAAAKTAQAKVPAKAAASAASMSTFATSTSTAHTVPHYKNSWDCLRQVVQQEGVRGLFRGMGASYLGIVESSLQWVLYEQLKLALKRYRQQQQQATPPSTATSTIVSSRMTDYFFTAAIAKTAAALATYPHEVLRTRLRQVVAVPSGTSGTLVNRPRYQGFYDVIRTVIKEEGILAFYGGMTAHLLRTVPNAAIMFFCYGNIRVP